MVQDGYCIINNPTISLNIIPLLVQQAGHNEVLRFRNVYL